jgi:imidazolonepropionase-like amidohydrolase
VTTVASLGGDAAPGFARREAQRRAPHSDARLYVAGPVLAPRTPEDARRDVDRVAATRPDWIKIRVDDNLGTAQKMPEPVYAAVIDQAHRHGLRVAAHMFYLDDAKRLVRAGADLLAHSVRDLAVDDELIALMKGRDICLCPTLMREVQAFVYADTPGFFADPFFVRHADPAVVAALASPARQASVRANRQTALYRQAHGVAAANVRRLAEAGVRIAFGTDTGPPGRFQGYFEHLELEEMAKAGLSTEAVLRSATSDAATCLKTPEIGALRPGALADLLVLARNPLESIANSRTIERVWIGGREVDR